MARSQTAARPQKDNDKMLTKRQQRVLKAMAASGSLMKTAKGTWFDTGVPKQFGCGTTSASTIYTLAHHGLVAFVDAYTVSPTPKGEALAALLDETTMVTRRGGGVVIS